MKSIVVLLCVALAAVAVHAIHTDVDTSMVARDALTARVTTTANAKAGIVDPLAACAKFGVVLLPAAKREQALRCDVCKQVLGAHIAAVPHRRAPQVPACDTLLEGKAASKNSAGQCAAIAAEVGARSVSLTALTHAERGGHNIDDKALGALYSAFMCGKKVLGCCADQSAPPKATFGKGELRTPPFFYRPYRAIRATAPQGFVLGAPTLKPFQLAPVSALHTPNQKLRVKLVADTFNAANAHGFQLAQANTNGGACDVGHTLPFPVTIGYTGGAKALSFPAPATPMTIDSPCEPKDLYGFEFEYWERIRYVYDFYADRPADDTARTRAKAGIVRRMGAGEGGYDEPWKDRFWYAGGYIDGVGCKRSGTAKVWSAIATDAQNGALNLAGKPGDYTFSATTSTSFTIDQVDRPGTSVSTKDEQQRYLRRDLYFGWTLRQPDGTKIEKAGIQVIEIEESLPTKITFVTADTPHRAADLAIASDLPGRDRLRVIQDADTDVQNFIAGIANKDLLKFEYVKRLPEGAGAGLKAWFPTLRAGTDLGVSFVDVERDNVDAMPDARCHNTVGMTFRGVPGKAFANYVIMPLPYWAGQRWVQKSCSNGRTGCLMVALVRPASTTPPPAPGKQYVIDRMFVTDNVQHDYSEALHLSQGCGVFRGRLWHEIPRDHY